MRNVSKHYVTKIQELQPLFICFFVDFLALKILLRWNKGVFFLEKNYVYFDKRYT